MERLQSWVSYWNRRWERRRSGLGTHSPTLEVKSRKELLIRDFACRKEGSKPRASGPAEEMGDVYMMAAMDDDLLSESTIAKRVMAPMFE